MKYVFPAETYGQDCVLVPIDKALVPLISGLLQHLLQDSVWQTREDYELGYNAIAEILSTMANNCLQELIESNNRIYRLLDTAFNGTGYSAEPDETAPGGQLITPDIPVVPPQIVNLPYALRAHVHRLQQLAENAATGAEYDPSDALQNTVALDYDGSWRARLLALQGEQGGFFGIGAKPVQLLDLLKAGRINTEADQGLINDGLQEVMSVLSSGGSIAGVVTDLLDTGADLASDGGVIAATLAVGLAQSAQLAELLPLLQRLVQTLDGGGAEGPADNIMAALRGAELAGAARNVIDAAAAVPPELAQLATATEEIRVKVQ